MKALILPLLIFSFFFGNSQETKIQIDYTVDYIVPSERRKTNDTVSIGYSKSGKFVWTDSKKLAQSLARNMFKNNPELLDNADLYVIYNAEDALLMMCFESGKNKLFFNVELSKLVPGPDIIDESNEFELISESTNESITILDKKAAIYDIYPSHKETDIVTMAFDESIKIDNTQLFKNLFQIMFASEGNSGLLGINIPEGLIMKVSSKRETILEAIHVDTTPKTININYSFKITE
ncbi:hypothetical protein [Psychroserpens sp. SPM9]|uniref:hypothetical protein n=1 Tax=Psychroserpens sp. SPM9 TaxID=2975598 RepID=UPI0021A4EEA6|nr:hypothetical protein [Psychroserpens sp. SPM9]MDG5493060.1 hypothetical protein [Psychroserpens sp. SPM9]